VLVRLRIGGIISVPWGWTDLLVPPSGRGPSPDEEPTTLLSPTALRDLVRFLRSHRTTPKQKKHFNG
jgi:hypothetical protein